MAKFSRGDRVLINGSLLATIQNYDEKNDRIAYVVVPPGGGTDTTYGHISQTRVEAIFAPITDPGEVEDVLNAVLSEPSDEITTSSFESRK